MTTHYVDTSALVKRYVDETGSGWLRAALGAQPAPAIIIVHLAVVEMTSALMRRLREGVLTPAEVAQLQNAFRSDCLSEYEIALAVGNIIDQANWLLGAYPLRAYKLYTWRQPSSPTSVWSAVTSHRSSSCPQTIASTKLPPLRGWRWTIPTTIPENDPT